MSRPFSKKSFFSFHPQPNIALKTEVLQKIGGTEVQLLASTRKEAKERKGERNHTNSIAACPFLSLICYLKRGVWDSGNTCVGGIVVSPGGCLGTLSDNIGWNIVFLTLRAIKNVAALGHWWPIPTSFQFRKHNLGPQCIIAVQLIFAEVPSPEITVAGFSKGLTKLG